ncbi:MAG: hydratase [Acetobacteraceae bacterium]|nr:hydratase [Acetobacteraceae bacterium]MSP30639.1 hydratase [Acetobacteraceae bacterium]
MTLSAVRSRAASDLIFSHWQEGTRIAALPEALRPATRAEGYAIQAHLEACSVQPLFGWKIAATSQAGQTHIGVDGPLAGRLLGEHVYQDGATLPWAHNFMGVAEAEFAFRMARDLPPRTTPYTAAEILDAVASLHPAIEVPDSRFTDFARVGAAQLIADNACGHDFVLGPAATADWRGMDLVEQRATARITGGAAHGGIGRNVLGDPRVALTWLVNELSQHGLTLRAGQVVTTGTCAIPLPIAPGAEMIADFGALGRVCTRFGFV